MSRKSRKGRPVKPHAPQWIVRVDYLGGFNRSKDRAIAACVGKHSDGSGFDFITRRRDLDFSFALERSAKAAVRRLRGPRSNVGRVRVRVFRERSSFLGVSYFKPWKRGSSKKVAR